MSTDRLPPDRQRPPPAETASAMAGGGMVPMGEAGPARPEPEAARGAARLLASGTWRNGPRPGQTITAHAIHPSWGTAL